jgi:Trk K+ transport system NAD-binding subunit
LENNASQDETAHVIVFGAGRFGRRLLHQLRARGFPVLAVDFDPDAVQALRAEGVPVHYGDAEDVDLAANLPLSWVKWIVSTLTEDSANRLLMQVVRYNGFQGKAAVALRAANQEESPAGLAVDRIFRPYDNAADFATEEIARELALPAEPELG